MAMTPPKVTRAASRCIFCGDSNLTKEDIFPRWLANVLTRAMVGDIMVVRTQQSTHLTETKTWGASDVASAPVRVVCRTCNNGWMHNLEDSCKPILQPMILGHPTRLSVASQLELATWTVMKAFVVEFTFGEVVVATQANREALKNNGHPHELAQVRLGAVEQIGIPNSIRRLVYNVGREGTHQGFATCTTFTLGCALLQACYGLGVATNWTRRVAPHDDHIPINPPCEDTQWPPRRSMTAETLGAWENPMPTAPPPWTQETDTQNNP